jgi:hypothetical protein
LIYPHRREANKPRILRNDAFALEKLASSIKTSRYGS